MRPAKAVASRLGDPHRLLGLRDAGLRLVEHADRLGDGGILGRQRGGRRLLVRGGRVARGERSLERGVGRADLAAQRRLLRGERAQGFREPRDLLRDPRLVLARERELLLDARDLGVGGVERSLPLVQRVTGGVVMRF